MTNEGGKRDNNTGIKNIFWCAGITACSKERCLVFPDLGTNTFENVGIFNTFVRSGHLRPGKGSHRKLG